MSKAKASDLAVKPIGVTNTPTASLIENPHNPRHLFDKADLKVLRESIAKVGILVPLTVYHRRKDGAQVILDGQRRWICAQELGLANVPVNVVTEPTPVQNIVTMFQIHKLRLDWELMPTALKIELLMSLLKDKNSKRIASLTGLDEAVVVRCKKLLSFDRSYQSLMLDADPEKRVKADFFIELYPVLHDRFVSRLPWFSIKHFTDQMLKKHAAGVLKSVTDFRIVKQRITNAVRADKKAQIEKRLKEFVDNESTTVDRLAIAEASVIANATNLSRACEQLSERIESLDVDSYAGESALWKSLKRLWDATGKKLRAAEYRDEHA